MYTYMRRRPGTKPSLELKLKTDTHTHTHTDSASLPHGSHFWNKVGVNHNSKEADTTKGRGH